MKKALLGLALAIVFGVGLSAETALENRMLVAPGSSYVNIGLDFGLGVNAGYEYSIGYFDINKLRFSYGAKAVGNVVFAGGVTGFGVGAVGTLHFSWGCLDLPKDLSWVGNIDTFIGLGLGYTGVASDYGVSGSLGLFTHGGSSYFFAKNMAVTVAGGLGGSYLGILMKL